MANRFPLIIDSATQRIEELPATDNLDLAGSNISSVANITSTGNITTSGNISASYFLGNGSALTGIVSAPGGSNTQLQYNNNGSFGGISTVTYDGSNISLGAIGNVKITGGSANQYVQTDGTGNLTFSTLNPASYELQPVNAATTINISLSGTQTIDGVAVTVGQRVLVKNQSVTTDNGVYVCQASAWTRATDFTTGASTLLGGVTVSVIAGTNYAGTQWICSNTSTITINSSPITFARNNINRIIASTLYSDVAAYVVQDPSVTNSIAFGNGANAQASQSTALGALANAGSYATAVGWSARAVGLGSTALGINANTINGTRSIAIGENANGNASLTVSLGYAAYAQGGNAIVIGTNTIGLGVSAISIGSTANANGANSIVMGYGSKATNTNTISIGENAGGSTSPSGTAGANAIAIGRYAGFNTQGANSIAIGANAGYTNQAANTIILNATGANLDQTTTNTFTVKPVRNVITGNVMFYNNTSGEISYDTLANNTSNISAANVTINSGGFMKLASYTSAALTAITGSIGWMAAVSDSAAGSNPNGMVAFWDTTNNRWSYIHDNSAV